MAYLVKLSYSYIQYLQKQSKLWQKQIHYQVYQSEMSRHFTNFHNDGQDYEETIVDVFSKLKDQLSDSNLVSIGNLQGLTNNFVFLFSYVLDAFTSMAKHNEHIKEVNRSLMGIIKRNGLAHQLQEFEYEYQQDNPELDIINEKMRIAISEKGQSATSIIGQKKKIRKKRKDHDLASEFSSASTPTKKQERKRTSFEYSMAMNFVNKTLKDMLEQDHEKLTQLPKNSILNVYLSQSQAEGRPISFQYLSSIQMALTNELKRHFPRIVHNQKSFRGIRFKQEYKDLVKTDVKIKKDVRENELQDSNEMSPPLPDFEDDGKANE